MAIEAAVDWRQQVADRLVSPAEAMRIVKSGDVVWMGALSSRAGHAVPGGHRAGG
jgi:acyl-CoA hydrolase